MAVSFFQNTLESVILDSSHVLFPIPSVYSVGYIFRIYPLSLFLNNPTATTVIQATILFHLGDGNCLLKVLPASPLSSTFSTQKKASFIF